jgi:hypothetical protein
VLVLQPQTPPPAGVTWECEVDGTWIEYAFEASAKLEAAYNTGESTVVFTYKIPGQIEQPYIFQHLQTARGGAGKITQTNQTTDVTRGVRRHNIKSKAIPSSPIHRQTSGAEWSTPETDLGGGASLRRLMYPDDHDDLADYTQDNEEIKKCMGTAMSMSDNFTTRGTNATQVKAVDYINNPNAYARFKACQTQFGAAGKSTNETWVFHGTKELSNAESIAKDKFLIGGVDGHPLQTGKLWGHAVYTDVKPDTPKAYGKFVLLCRALPGLHEKIGSDKMSIDDPCPGYDSWEPTTQPSWRMFRKNEQLLPVYIIHLK